MQIEFLIIAALLIIVSIFASKLSDRFGIPVLLLFLAIGMIAGSEGLGGIYFDNVPVANAISIVALVLVLFSGGFQTKFDHVRPVMVQSFSLATVGVLLTAAIVGLFASRLLNISILEGMLLGSIMSSTDAAAVFSILRSKGISLKGNLKPLLELESGSNDPMAVFLTIGMIQLIQQPDPSILQIILLFFRQMILGALIGYLMGRFVAFLMNRINLGYEGLYPVLSLSLVLLTYGVTDILKGSGFLAVYFMGIAMNYQNFAHKRTIQRFHDGFGWLMQIIMFGMLGLFIFPSQLLPVAGVASLVAVVLILVARPISVFLTLIPNSLKLNEKVLISWVGLRGAAPLILATFPLLAGIQHSEMFFNITFFVVLISLLLQGTTLPPISRWLGLAAPLKDETIYPLEYQWVAGMESDLVEVDILPDSPVTNRTIAELNFTEDLLVVLIKRGDEFITPKGRTTLRENDKMLILSDEKSLDFIKDQYQLGWQQYEP